MRRLLPLCALGLAMSVACAQKSPPTTVPAQSAVRTFAATAGAACVPAAVTTEPLCTSLPGGPLIQAGDPFAVAFCSPDPNPSTVGSESPVAWYRVLLDDVQQAHPGPLIKGPTVDSACNYQFQTPATLVATAGPHTLKLSLISNGGTGPESTVVAKTFTVAPVTPVVNCVVSAWSPFGPWSAWTPINATTETRTQTRTRTVVTQASGGGTACPSLSETTAETRPISQPCTYTLSAPGQSFQSPGGAGNVAVTTTAGCPWAVTSGASWLTVTAGGNSTGPGSTTFGVAANTATGRTGALTLAGQAFTVSQAGVPTTDCTGAVVLTVGNWTRSARVGDSAQVTYSLTKSRSPVVRFALSLDGVEVPPVADGTTDVRQFGLSYFIVPPGKGDHKVTVSAKDAKGCEDGSSRPMTITVK